MIKKIVSGGQTGVDRAALDVAIQFHIPHGGWCPKNRKAEDGIIPSSYCLQETESEDYKQRTELNICDADGTLILVTELPAAVTDGTIFMINLVQQRHKPYLIIDLSDEHHTHKVVEWLKRNDIEILNIGGPRESQRPGIYQLSFYFLAKVFKLLQY